MIELTNNLLRKSPTSSVDEGPPMFMNTIAVGPCAPTALCVTGGATVAIYDRWSQGCPLRQNVALEQDSEDDFQGNWAMDLRMAITRRRSRERYRDVSNLNIAVVGVQFQYGVLADG
jgi:hypothetical protein